MKCLLSADPQGPAVSDKVLVIYAPVMTSLGSLLMTQSTACVNPPKWESYLVVYHFQGL